MTQKCVVFFFQIDETAKEKCDTEKYILNYIMEMENRKPIIAE